MSSSSSSSSSSNGNSSSSRSHNYEYAGREVEILMRSSTSGSETRHSVDVSVDGKTVSADLLGEQGAEVDFQALESKVKQLIDDKKI